MRKELVRAIDERNLEEVMRRAGLLEALSNGDVRCEVCSRAVGIEDIAALRGTPKGIAVVCGRAGCLEESSRRTRR